MNKVLAIARVSLRNAARSRVVICLVLILLLVNTGIPLSVKGDGTVGGFVHVLVSYSLGLAAFILAVTTLWAGSASVSVEINDKTAQMIVTKPVSPWQLWLGKWIGLNIMNAGLLALCGAITFIMLQTNLKPSDWPPHQREEAERLLTAREAIPPLLPDYNAAVRHELDEQLKLVPLPDGVTETDALRAIIQQKMFAASMVAPDASIAWDFGAAPVVNGDATVSLQYRFSSSSIGQAPITGEWIIRAGDAIEPLRINRTSAPRALNEFSFTLPAGAAGQPLIIEYRNLDRENTTVIFDINEGIKLLVPRGGFAANYIRGLLVLFGQLSLLAAIGVTAGCLFSLPVATFIAMFVLLLIQMSGYIRDVADSGIFYEKHSHGYEDVQEEGGDHGPATLGQLTGQAQMILFKGIAFIIQPLRPDNPLNALSTGRMVNYATTARALGGQGLFIALLIGALATQALKRRELALPSA